MPDLAHLSDEQLSVYREMLAKKGAPQAAATPAETPKKGFIQSAIDATGIPDAIASLSPSSIMDAARAHQDKIHSQPLSATMTDAAKQIVGIPAAIPLQVGRAAVTAKDQAVSGDYAGAAGTVVGTAAPFLIPELARGGRAAWNRAVAKVGTPAAKGLMQSALKPGVADAPEMADVRSVVDTALKHEIPVTESGLAKHGGILQGMQQEVQNVIDQAAAAGGEIDPVSVSRRLDDMRDKYARQALPEKDLAVIDKAKEEFLRTHGKAAPAPGAAGPTRGTFPIPADEAQRIKQGTYGKTYGEGDSSATLIEAEKQLARGFKEDLETMAPELKGLNAEEGKMLELGKVLSRTVRREGNKDLLNAGDVMAGGGGALAGGPVGAAAGAAAKHTLDSAAFKSNLAIALNRAAKKAGNPVPMDASMYKAIGIISALQNKQNGEVK